MIEFVVVASSRNHLKTQTAALSSFNVAVFQLKCARDETLGNESPSNLEKGVFYKEERSFCSMEEKLPCFNDNEGMFNEGGIPLIAMRLIV